MIFLNHCHKFSPIRNPIAIVVINRSSLCVPVDGSTSSSSIAMIQGDTGTVCEVMKGRLKGFVQGLVLVSGIDDDDAELQQGRPAKQRAKELHGGWCGKNRVVA